MITGIVCSFWFIIYLSTICCFQFSWLICCIIISYYFIRFYYYIHVRSSIILCLSSGNIYLSRSIPSLILTELCCGKLLETPVILLAVLLAIKSSVASTVFFLAFFNQFQVHLWQIIYNEQEISYCIYCLSFYLYFYQQFSPYFYQKTKIHSLLQISHSLVELSSLSFFICYTLFMLYFN